MELPAPGQIFQRKYKLQDILGRGGFAAVYRATDIEIGRDVAIKVLAPGEDGYSTGIASRFMREARVIGGFQDPHTITMFEFGRSDDGLLFMVFEYVKGDDLAKVIRQRGSLPQADVIHIMKQVLQSLREAHTHSVLHRDIKPANILVYDYMGDPNRVKLLDFGIAKAVAGDEAGINLTREGAMIGTPRYMSPEQIYGGELSPRSDLYSLGLVVHEMLVGKPAISGTTSKEMLRAQLADAPVTLPRDRVAATPAFCDVIDRLTSRDPDLRFQDAAEVMQALTWIEQNDPDVPRQSGALAGMPISGISPGYATPSGEHSYSGERSWERSGALAGQPNPTPLPHHRSGQIPAYQTGPQQPYGSGMHPVHHSGPMHAPGPHPHGQPGPHPPYHPNYTPRPPTQEDVPPSTERPRTLEEDDNISLGTVLGAGLGAAALVVGLLMLMSFLSGREPEAPAPTPTDEPTVENAPEKTEKTEAANTPAIDAGAAPAIDEPPKPKASGCGDTAPWRAEKKLTMSVGGIEREVLVYLPSKYDPKKPHPVVLMFHGRGKQGRDVVNDTRFKQLADDNAFIIVAPDGLNRDAPWSGDQTAFVQKAIDETAAAGCVDRSKVFAIGHDKGAVLARSLPCSMPVSAVAMTGYGIEVGEKLCTAERPVPAIRFHGTQDRYSPFKGGTGCQGTKFVAVSDAESNWRRRNGCDSAKPKTYLKEGRNKCYEWTCDEPFVSCHLDGGHEWPSAPPAANEIPSCVAKSADFPIGEEIWKFFEAHGVSLDEAK